MGKFFKCFASTSRAIFPRYLIQGGMVPPLLRRYRLAIPSELYEGWQTPIVIVCTAYSIRLRKHYNYPSGMHVGWEFSSPFWNRDCANVLNWLDSIDCGFLRQVDMQREINLHVDCVYTRVAYDVHRIMEASLHEALGIYWFFLTAPRKILDQQSRGISRHICWRKQTR